MALPGRDLLRALASSATAPRNDTEPRVRHFQGRAHIAVRGLRLGQLSQAEAAKLAEDVERRLAEVPGVAWVAVNTVLGYAVVATEAPTGTEDIASALIDAVEAVEKEHGVERPLPGHPLSGGPVRRAALALAAHLAAA
ncbi:hypothetical protein, partial [Streptomyces sp. SID2888]|uniref:hypothetical protein n=1 Tax=Streptomyces sp. SID2888 TaxID=2690256 RepID=UPI00136FABE6